MKRFLSASAAALALLLMTGLGVQANPMPPNLSWTYNFTPGGGGLLVADSNPGAHVSLTNENSQTAVGNSTIVGTNLREASTASATLPDTLLQTGTNGNYTLALALATTDDTGLHQATLTFHGQISGTFSHDSSNLFNAFGADALQTATLGAYTFTVALDHFTPPGPPGQSNAGSISASVTIASNAQVTQTTPEPGTMLLSGLALSFFGGAAWRKRRQARVVVAN
jgi:PEP-CTERM motif